MRTLLASLLALLAACGADNPLQPVHPRYTSGGRAGVVVILPDTVTGSGNPLLCAVPATVYNTTGVSQEWAYRSVVSQSASGSQTILTPESVVWQEWGVYMANGTSTRTFYVQSPHGTEPFSAVPTLRWYGIFGSIESLTLGTYCKGA